MLLSCLLAFIFPFQLFLFSFAILGPLHYFTEIPWLHGKKYYATGKYDYLMLIALCFIIGAIHYLSPDSVLRQKNTIDLLGSFVFLAFFGALGITFLKVMWQKVLFLFVIGTSTLLFSNLSFFGMLFANFVPTIIHVYIFTGCFILYGALRHKSATGIFSLLVFAVCTLLIFVVTPDPQANRSLSFYVKSSYLYFAGLNFDLMNLFGLQEVTPQSERLGDVLFSSNAGIIVMRLIAFSYTYHFLNWFSKTSIIKWHQVAKKNLAIIATMWIASIGLYFYSYRIGLEVLYFMSLLHVVLEFPLNQRTFVGIGKELRGLVIKTV